MHRLATIHSVQRNTTDLYATLYQYKLTVKDRQTENDSLRQTRHQTKGLWQTVGALNGFVKVLAMKMYKRLAHFSYLAKTAINNGKRTSSTTDYSITGAERKLLLHVWCVSEWRRSIVARLIDDGANERSLNSVAWYRLVAQVRRWRVTLALTCDVHKKITGNLEQGVVVSAVWRETSDRRLLN